MQGDADVVGEELLSVEEDFVDVFALVGHLAFRDAQARHFAHQFQEDGAFRHTERVRIEDGRVAQDAHLFQFGHNDSFFHRDGFLVEGDGVQFEDIGVGNLVCIGVGAQVGDLDFVVFVAFQEGHECEIAVFVSDARLMIGRVGQTEHAHTSVLQRGHALGLVLFHLYMSGDFSSFQ